VLCESRNHRRCITLRHAYVGVGHTPCRQRRFRARQEAISFDHTSDYPNLGHTADHIARGDLTWPLTAPSLPSVIITLAIYAVLGFGLYFYVTNKVGPGFWAIAAGIGVLFGWLAHFSPFTDQTPQYICSAYKTPGIGWLALLWLVALMISLIVAGLYAEYLWARQPKRR